MELRRGGIRTILGDGRTIWGDGRTFYGGIPTFLVMDGRQKKKIQARETKKKFCVVENHDTIRIPNFYTLVFGDAGTVSTPRCGA